MRTSLLKTSCVALLLAGAWLARPAALPAAERVTATLAHIKLTGDLDETPVAPDPLFGIASENFKAKLERIAKAKKDPLVQALYLELDGLEVGWGKLEELARAIADFRKSGKPAFAYLEGGGSKDYLVALACDRIYLPESGALMLTGVRMEVAFFKEMFDKIGVKADMLQMGAFKGAAEPFTRKNLSPENRQQLESVLDDFYTHDIVGRIARGRKTRGLTADQVKKLIDEGPFTAKAALKAALVDGLAYPAALPESLKGELKVETVKVQKDYAKTTAEVPDLGNPLALFKLLKPAAPKLSRKPKVAVVHVIGVINTGKSSQSLLGGSSAGSTTLVEAIRQAEEDATVKAIVLRVDSPGGSALASDLIWNELNRCKKPVVASMSDVAASGGYYVSMAANKIYAEPGTLTGSIGVVGGKIAVGGLFETVGIRTETLKRGQNAEMFSIERPFSASEKKAMLEIMRDIYDQFLTKALAGRVKAGKKMSREELEKLAGGRIWTGRQALANGLIDAVGTLDDAVADAWQMAKMPKETEPELLVLPRPKPLLDQVLESLGEGGSPLGQLRRHPALRELTERLVSVEGMLNLRRDPVWAVVPFSIKVR